ncbi:MAG: hypothetical protein DRI39_05385 [Chloroflexi bacterium]|nr:MAG: hypothetical protein DRI39_05385 [Chloroflexota bacterium]
MWSICRWGSVQITIQSRAREPVKRLAEDRENHCPSTGAGEHSAAGGAGVVESTNPRLME